MRGVKAIIRRVDNHNLVVFEKWRFHLREEVSRAPGELLALRLDVLVSEVEAAAVEAVRGLVETRPPQPFGEVPAYFDLLLSRVGRHGLHLGASVAEVLHELVELFNTRLRYQVGELTLDRAVVVQGAAAILSVLQAHLQSGEHLRRVCLP